VCVCMCACVYASVRACARVCVPSASSRNCPYKNKFWSVGRQHATPRCTQHARQQNAHSMDEELDFELEQEGVAEQHSSSQAVDQQLQEQQQQHHHNQQQHPGLAGVDWDTKGGGAASCSDSEAEDAFPAELGANGGLWDAVCVRVWVCVVVGGAVGRNGGAHSCCVPTAHPRVGPRLPARTCHTFPNNCALHAGLPAPCAPPAHACARRACVRARPSPTPPLPPPAPLPRRPGDGEQQQQLPQHHHRGARGPARPPLRLPACLPRQRAQQLAPRGNGEQHARALRRERADGAWSAPRRCAPIHTHAHTHARECLWWWYSHNDACAAAVVHLPPTAVDPAHARRRGPRCR